MIGGEKQNESDNRNHCGGCDIKWCITLDIHPHDHLTKSKNTVRPLRKSVLGKGRHGENARGHQNA